jgi:hypothetical protein
MLLPKKHKVGILNYLYGGYKEQKNAFTIMQFVMRCHDGIFGVMRASRILSLTFLTLVGNIMTSI